MQYAMHDAAICVCSSVAFKLVTCMHLSTACAKHTATLRRPDTFVQSLLIQQSMKANRCSMHAVRHLCLQLSGLQATHLHALELIVALLHESDTVIMVAMNS